MTMTIERGLPDADTNGIHDVLCDTKDYARRIHWWIRLFGVVWLASLAFAVAAGLFIGIATAVQLANSADGTSGGTSGMTYRECMADPDTTSAQCELLR